jgi:DNA-binding transcriptional MerR regulator
VINENSTFGIGDLAREFKITARAIRFYEDQGMLKPSRSGATGRVRVYSQRDRARLTLLLRGKRLGLKLSEIRDLLDMYETPADTVPQLARFLDLLDQRHASLQRQLADLHLVMAEIDQQRLEARRMLRELEARMPASGGTVRAAMSPENAAL